MEIEIRSKCWARRQLPVCPQWLSLCWSPREPPLDPRTFHGPRPLLAWKVRGTASSHLVERPGSSHILLVPIPGHLVPCQCLHSLTSSLAALREWGPLFSPGQRDQLRFRGAKSLACSHPAGKWQSQDLNPLVSLHHPHPLASFAHPAPTV